MRRSLTVLSCFETHRQSFHFDTEDNGPAYTQVQIQHTQHTRTHTTHTQVPLESKPFELARRDGLITHYARRALQAKASGTAVSITSPSARLKIATPLNKITPQASSAAQSSAAS